MTTFELVVGLVLCSFFAHLCSGEVHSSNATYQELYADWTENGHPNDHGFPRRCEEMYAQNPASAQANNLMGILAHQDRNLTLASMYFRTASHLSGYNSEEFLRNYIRIQNQINYVDTIWALIPELRKSVHSDVLYDELYVMLSALQIHHDLPLTIVMQIVSTLPTKYNMWVLLVNSILRDHNSMGLTFAQDVQHTSDSIFHFDTNAGTFDVQYTKLLNTVTFGLSLFPRSPELLMLRSMMHYSDKDIICAQQIAERATRMSAYSANGSIAENHFTAYQRLLTGRGLSLR